MKNIYLFFLFLLLSPAGCKSTKPLTEKKAVQTTTQHAAQSTPAADATPAVINYNDQTTWILGYFNPERLTHYPYSTWYLPGFDEYEPKTDPLNHLLDVAKDGISIKVVMGTWCPDSRKQVPRFMKIVDSWKFPADKITFIGVDDAKQSPVGEYTKLDIKRVPTFIIYKNNIEAGRIIENPVTSLEQDIVNILTGMNNK